MSNFVRELEQIKTLISSSQKLKKSSGYSSLLHLQEQLNNDDSFILSLVESSHAFVSSIIVDVEDQDEEISVQALKCLGFLIYHPSIVASIPMNIASFVVVSLASLITTTKIKSVCNLGIWCISIQQLESSFLVTHFDSLLRAVIHALDNPIGSLSTTFEAIQAVMKLGTQLSKEMREGSSIWAPPIYKRLLSKDKREREMSQRCLMRMKSVIYPPPSPLSKVVVRDVKSTLLTRMKELVKHDKKVQALQAWGWFVRLMGLLALKNLQLVNELLKIPQQTFSDQDPQVQIASQAAWEGLIDALIYLPSEDPDIMKRQKLKVQTDGTVSIDISESGASEIQRHPILKSLKLIMMPLTGIMSFKHDLAVQSSCLNTWCYLLHKLDGSVNDLHVLSKVLEPILTAVFQGGPHNRDVFFWNFCFSLLDDFVQAKSKNVDHENVNKAGYNLLFRPTDCEALMSTGLLWSHYPVKWFPWDCSKLEFLLKMVQITISGATVASVSAENKISAYNFAVRIFCSILKGVQTNFKKASMGCNVIIQSLTSILMFVKKTCEDIFCGKDGSDELLATCLQLVQAVVEELQPSTLESPIYRVSLDLKFKNCVSSHDLELQKRILGVSSLCSMDMATPAIYLTILYISVVVQSTAGVNSVELILNEFSRYVKRVLLSFDAVEILHAIVGFLYDHSCSSCLRVWVATARCLQEYLDHSKELTPLRVESSARNFAPIYFLLYPLVMCASAKVPSTEKDSKSFQESSIFTSELTIEQVTEVWKSLYVCINSAHQMVLPEMNRFADDLCSSLNGFLCQITSMNECSSKISSRDDVQEVDLLPLFAEVARCTLDNIQFEKMTREISDADYRRSSGIKNCLVCFASIVKLSWENKDEEPLTSAAMLLRLLSPLESFIARLQLKEDIICLFEVMPSLLLPWLSGPKMTEENLENQLGSLWISTLKCLHRSWPPITFGSLFLELQAPLLEKTLDHPSTCISEPTIAFWNSTYGRRRQQQQQQTELPFPPPCLVPVLDKLSREGKIKIDKRTSPVPKKDEYFGYKVTTRLNMGSKRVELLEETISKNRLLPLGPCAKRSRLELTDHQKEVRRAQQGKERDCGGHGPGIRTYTGADFSQGNENGDSQESPGIRNPDLILDLLRRVC